MSRNLRNFAAGALGAIALEATFFVRHPEAITQHPDGFGPAALAVALSTLVLLATLTGLFALAVRPAHAFGAFLFGVIPPAICIAAGLPRWGTDPASPRPADAMWLALSPARYHAEGVSAGVVAREAEVVEAAVTTERETAAVAQRRAIDAAVSTVITDLRDMHAAEIAELRAAANAERQAAVAEAETAASARIAALTERLSRETETARAAVEARDRAESERTALQAEVTRLTADGGTAAELRRQLAVAAERREEIAREREDYRRLVAWYQSDVPPDGATPLRVLSRRLASESSEDRVVAARLLAICGPAARPILERARADRDALVREAVETTLVSLDR